MIWRRRLWRGPGHRAGPSLGMYILPTIPRVGAIFKDTALRGQCIVETWKAYVAERHEGFCFTLKILAGVCGDLLIFWLPKTSLLGKLSCSLTLPPTNLQQLPPSSVSLYPLYMELVCKLTLFHPSHLFFSNSCLLFSHYVI